MKIRQLNWDEKCVAPAWELGGGFSVSYREYRKGWAAQELEQGGCDLLYSDTYGIFPTQEEAKAECQRVFEERARELIASLMGEE